LSYVTVTHSVCGKEAFQIWMMVKGLTVLLDIVYVCPAT